MSPYIMPGLKLRPLQRHHVNFDNVMEIVLKGSIHNIPEITSKSRVQDVVAIRMVAMWALRRNTPITLKSLGKLFNRDHTTVIHACQTVDRLIYACDDKIMAVVEKIRMHL